MSAPDQTQEFRPIAVSTDGDKVPHHFHDLPHHEHEPRDYGVAIGLTWLSMSMLSIALTVIMSFFVGIERWERYIADKDASYLPGLLALGLVFAPLAIAATWTSKLAKQD